MSLSLALPTQFVFAFSAPSCRKFFREDLKGYWVQSHKNNLAFVNTDEKAGAVLLKQVGLIDFSYIESNKSLYIEWVHVNSGFRKRGLSTRMFEELLDLYPEAEQVTGYLTDKNLEIFEKAIKETSDIENAIKKTPFYLAVATLGFTRIVERAHFDGKVMLVLQKESPLH